MCTMTVIDANTSTGETQDGNDALVDDGFIFWSKYSAHLHKESDYEPADANTCLPPSQETTKNEVNTYGYEALVFAYSQKL